MSPAWRWRPGSRRQRGWRARWCCAATYMIRRLVRWVGSRGTRGCSPTTADLARYARMMLGGGALGDVRLFKKETVALMTSVQSPPGISARRGLGWDIDSPYASLRGKKFPRGSYGHTGWTGTSLWIDPFSKSFLIFLSNRNHPTERGSVRSLRVRLADLAAQSISGFRFFASRRRAPGIGCCRSGRQEKNRHGDERDRSAARGKICSIEGEADRPGD